MGLGEGAGSSSSGKTARLTFGIFAAPRLVSARMVVRGEDFAFAFSSSPSPWACWRWARWAFFFSTQVGTPMDAAEEARS